MRLLRGDYGMPIGNSSANPILYTRIYEAEYSDVHKSSHDANSIAENMFAQVDGEGNIHVLFEEIIDH